MTPLAPAVTGVAAAAGFRDRAELLDSTFLRMGMLAVLRSRYVALSPVKPVAASLQPLRCLSKKV